MSAPPLQATSIEELPDVDGTTPGLFLVVSENATRYLISCVPEGRNRAIRISYYGFHGRWRPYVHSHVYNGQRYPSDPQTVRVGQMMLIYFGRYIDDYYRSGRVTEILRYDLPDALRLEEIEAAAHEAMIDAAHDVMGQAYRAGRIPDEETLREVCGSCGLDPAEVLRRGR